MQSQFTIGNSSIRLRPATEIDWDFQLALYGDTRADEMALVDWPPEQKLGFLSQQFHAQTSHYQNYFPSAVTKIIWLDDLPIGRMILNFNPDFIHIIDIALLFKYRNLGIGSILIKDLQDEAKSLRLPIILRVEIFNPAIRLYQRFGFEKSKSMEVYQEMVWSPPPIQNDPE